jgi:opacity protein-like surface antigen
MINLNKPFVFPSLILFLSLFFSVFAMAQETYDSEYNSYASNKPVVDYYENMDDKSFYQQKRIHGMKGELNNYSEKLHNLQDRFDKIFYGLSSQGNFKTPFDTSNQPARPVIQPRVEYTPPAAQVNPSLLDDIPEVNQPSANQLAFNVNSPGTFTQDDKVVSTFNPNSKNGAGYYLLFRPGMAFASKIHKNADSYKRFDHGFSATLAGGFRVNNFNIGLGGVYKKHSFHDDSKLRRPRLLSLTGDSETYSGFLDLGYNLNVSSSIDLYAGIGVGYYLTLIDDNRDLSSRKDHGVFLTGSTGISWKMSEVFALSLGYRYVYEDEVPAHIVELGANFTF